MNEPRESGLANRLIDFSLDNRVVVIVLWILATLAGIASLRDLPIDAVPDITNVQVQVLTDAPGLGPEEVERLITFPIESALSGVPRVEEIRSVSRLGLSAITVGFEEGTDIYWARQLIAERLTVAREAIPEQLGAPQMGPISTGLGEIYQFEVRGEGYDALQLREILDWTVNYQLRSTPGVVEVNPAGGELKTYQVTLDPARLASYAVAIGDVRDALLAQNRNVGGGYLTRGGEQYVVRGAGMLANVEHIGSVVVRGGDGGSSPLYVRDLGRVELAPMIRQGSATRDGRGEAVIGVVMMLYGANSRTVAADVHARIAEIEKTLPPGVTIDTWYDRTELVDRTIRTVAINLLEGGALVILVLLLLLGDWRAGLVTAASIPLSMLVAFSAMRLAGISGNLMSLGAIDFGLIVDGSVVLIENIARVVHQRRKAPGSHLEKVRAACHEVSRPVVFAVGVILVVYLPLLALRGIEGKMFRPMALTVVFALAASLICALTLMPVLASLLLRKPHEREPFLARWVRAVYQRVLPFTMARPLAVGLAALAIFVSSLGIVRTLGAEFIPSLDEGALAIQISRSPAVSLEKSDEISTRAERVIVSFPEVTTVVSRTGRPEIATDPMGVELSDTYVMLKPPSEWRFETKDELIAALEARLVQEVPEASYSFTQPIALRMAELISGVRSDIGILIFAPGGEIAEMRRCAEQVARSIENVAGVAEVQVEQVDGLPNIRIELDRESIARLGFDANAVLDVVEALAGVPAGAVLEGERRFEIRLRFGSDVRASIDGLGRLPVAGMDSEGVRRVVPLSELARIHIEEGPAQISREKVSRRIAVSANVRGRDLASTVADARAAIERDIALPGGWWIEWGGQFENLVAASERLAWLVPMALLLVLALLYSTFSSLPLALLIFLNVPLAATGGLAALYLRGYPFSISAAVGFIALFGIAVMNGVVLISTVARMRAEGASPHDAARGGALLRLRPVTMTALVAALGFLPMALSTTAGAEVQRPLATVVIGGLVTCSLLTLLVLPTLYAAWERWREKHREFENE
jgi:cobalt-zinc-cadmium resistance protein CzcA